MKIMVLGYSLETRYDASQYYLTKQLAKMENVVLYGLERLLQRLIPISCFLNLPLLSRIDHKLGTLWLRLKRNVRSARVIKDVVKIARNESPDVVLMEACFPFVTRWKNLSQVKIPKALIIEDFHRDTEKQLKYVEESNVDLVLFRYKQWMNIPVVKKWIKRKKVNVEWLPHCVNTKIFRDYGIPRNSDVVSSGRCSQKVYPFRVGIRDVLSATPGIRFSMPKHVTYELIKGKPSSEVLMFENYAKFLSLSKIFIFGSSIYNYALAKYTEGMACNTLVMAPMPKDGKDLHFASGKNLVKVNHSNFVKKIRYYLKHEDERRQIALSGLKTVQKYHTAKKRATELITYLASICK